MAQWITCDVGHPSVSVPWPFSLPLPISDQSDLREEKGALAQSLREYNPCWWGRHGGRNVKLLVPISVDPESEKEECQSLIGSFPFPPFIQPGTQPRSCAHSVDPTWKKPHWPLLRCASLLA